jgi:hypothetical protein
MFKKIVLLLAVIHFSGLHAQENTSLYKVQKIKVTTDTIHLEKENLNSAYFNVFDAKEVLIDSSYYKIDFLKGTLLLKDSTPVSTDSISVSYLKFPDFLTKEYHIYDPSSVVSNKASTGDLYKIETAKTNKSVPLDGLNTSGSITRGITIGSNQNTVLSSNLDLQITGKLSSKVSIRASLQDTNIPIQDGGYSQKLDEFDNVFMELYSDKWNIRAGDVFLENHNTKYLTFDKKVQGLIANFDFGTKEDKTNLFAAAGVVKGQYVKCSITAEEGNQGPYELTGDNGESSVVVISGSERVYVNGLLLKRGENNDYTIDYNAGEVLFTTLYPITSEMRITVEYQYSDQYYTRLITYAGGTHQDKKWTLGGYLYSEIDLKNQPLQQTISTDEIAVFASAGDDEDLMETSSATATDYDEDEILYKKETINGVEVYVYTEDEEDDLYSVTFTLMGDNAGDYSLISSDTVDYIYEYVEPIDGVQQGSYAPTETLVAPVKIQVASFVGSYKSTDKTAVDFEIALSNNDENLYSTLDDYNNQGFATKVNAKQRLFSKKWNLDAFANYQLIHQNFSSVEGYNSIEFNRDWNLESTLTGNQSYLVSGLNMSFPKKGTLVYQFEKLDYSGSFSGNRHVINAAFNTKNWSFKNEGSFLKSDAESTTSKFIRNKIQAKHYFKKNWIGASVDLEDNQEKDKTTDILSSSSQRFLEYGLLVGRGDSTKVYAQLGYYKRLNDSVQSEKMQRVNNSQTFILKSKLIQNTKSDLSVFVNYRVLDYTDATEDDITTLNSRVLFNNRFFNQFVQTTSSYETNSGTISELEYTFTEVTTGSGVYLWNDYDGDGVEDLTEFEVATNSDEADYVLVYLSTLNYIKTHQNKFSQSITINPSQWQNKTGFKKTLSAFYNQISYLIDRKIENKGDNFDLDPFDTTNDNILGLSYSFRNSLFFNRGKQRHSMTYSYVESKTKSLLSIGSQEADNSSHELQYSHLVKKSWLIGMNLQSFQTNLTTENYTSKNYEIYGYELSPKINYLFSKNTNWGLFYNYVNKENKIGNLDTLSQNNFGTSFAYSSTKDLTMSGQVALYQNKYTGDEDTSVAYKMLDGLETGQNFSWTLLLQKKLNKFLDLSLNYEGRKSESSSTIHTGTVQLRASF